MKDNDDICEYCGVFKSEHDRDHLATECFPRRIDNLNIIKEKYNELIMAVQRKFPRESRHETALRYIKEAECDNKENLGKNTILVD